MRGGACLAPPPTCARPILRPSSRGNSDKQAKFKTFCPRRVVLHKTCQHTSIPGYTKVCGMTACTSHVHLASGASSWAKLKLMCARGRARVVHTRVHTSASTRQACGASCGHAWACAAMALRSALQVQVANDSFAPNGRPRNREKRACACARAPACPSCS